MASFWHFFLTLLSSLLAAIGILVGLFLVFLLVVWIGNLRDWKSDGVRWGNLGVGLLSLFLGIVTVRSGHIGQLRFPEMNASGLQACIVGALWLIVAGICLWGSLKRRTDQERHK